MESQREMEMEREMEGDGDGDGESDGGLLVVRSSFAKLKKSRSRIAVQSRGVQEKMALSQPLLEVGESRSKIAEFISSLSLGDPRSGLLEDSKNNTKKGKTQTKRK